MELEELIYRHEILDVIARYYAAIDDFGFSQETVDTTFTADGRIVYSTGAMASGRSDIFDTERSHLPQDLNTTHLLSNPLVIFDPSRRTASLRENLWITSATKNTHVSSHLAGFTQHVIVAKLIREQSQWNVTLLTIRDV